MQYYVGWHDLVGVKLEPKKGVFHILIVDHAEKTPTQN
jgi:uncharacterized protein (TIGR03435 family)